MSWLTDKQDARNKYIKSLPTKVVDGRVEPADSVRNTVDRNDWRRLHEYEKSLVAGELRRARKEAEPEKSNNEMLLEMQRQRQEEYKLSQMTFREAVAYKTQKEFEANVAAEKRSAGVRSSDGWKQLMTSLDNVVEVATGTEHEMAFAALRSSLQDQQDIDADGLAFYQQFFDARLVELDRSRETQLVARMSEINEQASKTEAETVEVQKSFDKFKTAVKNIARPKPPAEPESGVQGESNG